MLECMPIYDVLLFCSKLFAPFRGKVVQNPLFGATTHKYMYMYIDFTGTALNAGIRRERKSQISTNLEKNAPVMPTSPSNHVCGKLEL